MLALREAAGAALLLQLARLLIVDSARRASLPPVTAVGLLCYSFAAAAAALGALPPASAATLEPSALAASPARLLASLLLYRSLAGLGCHLWLWLAACERLEPALGSRRLLVVLLLCTGGAAALAAATVPPVQRRYASSLAPATLFALLQLWAQSSPESTVTLVSVRLQTRRLPWALLAAVAILDGVTAALSPLLGIGAAAIYHALVGLPHNAVLPPPPPPTPSLRRQVAGEGDTTTEHASGAAAAAGGGGGGANAAGVAPDEAEGGGGTRSGRVAQAALIAVGVALLLGEGGGGSGAAARLQAQCGVLSSLADLTEPLTAQLVANFTALRLDAAAEPEGGERAFEWLAARWRLLPHGRAAAAYAALAEGGEEAAERRQALYVEQLPISPHISPYLPIPPHISPYLPLSPHISP